MSRSGVYFTISIYPGGLLMIRTVVGGKIWKNVTSLSSQRITSKVFFSSFFFEVWNALRFSLLLIGYSAFLSFPVFVLKAFFFS